MFRRILVWFCGLLLVTFVAYVLTSTYLSPQAHDRGDFFRRMVSFQVSEAVKTYEQQGPAALKEYLATLDFYFRAKHYLLDKDGRDLTSGADRSDLVRAGSVRPRFRLMPPAYAVMQRPSEDGRFRFVAELPLRGDPWKDLSVYGWIVLVVVLLCYVLAWRLARPIKVLHDAVVRFGQGELTARSQLKSRDEVGALSAAFDQMAGRIETLLTAERRLLQDISHELRSPLTRLRFAVELARPSCASPAPLDRITKEVDRLSILVNELLQVTRAEGDPASRSTQVIDLPTFLSSMIEDLRIEAEARGATLELSAPDRLQWTGDRELLHRAVENVMRNAIRHTDSGRSVQVALEKQPGWIVIQVRDYGPGVPEEALPKIFQPFYRVDTDRSRASGGVGLGLAIANRAVRVHHGEIEARNLHPGLLVELKLPDDGSPVKSV